MNALVERSGLKPDPNWSEAIEDTNGILSA